MNVLQNNKGMSLIEAIIALAVFGLMAAALVAVGTGGYTGVVRGEQYTQATALAEEGLEAVRAVRDRAYNELLYATSSVAVSGSQWVVDGTLTETIGQYTRTITFDDVCRDASDNLVACPATSTDAHSRLVTSEVAWEIRPGVTTTIERRAYITNWDSSDWKQTDWSGGSGQAIWSAEDRYDSDDGNVDVQTTGEVRLLAQGEACGIHEWGFDNAGDYVFNPSDIQVAGGRAQVASQGSIISSTTTDPGFDTGIPWSAGQWDFDSGDGSLNNRISSLGNPTWWVYDYVYFSSAGREVGGYWQQAFSVTETAPETAVLEFDYQPWLLTLQTGDEAWFYAFVESSSGEPSSPGNAVWSHQFTGADTTQTWVENVSVTVTSSIATPGTYYLKLGMWLDSTGSGSGGLRRALGGYDNAELYWQKNVSSYATNVPPIYATRDYEPSTVGSWISFSETASKNGGEIYYQLSDDDGATWYYWTGASWASAVGSQYNTAAVVDTNIGSFSTSTGQIRFRAFLESDGTQFVQLDSVEIGCERYDNWPFDVPSNYTYNASEIEVASGTARLAPAGLSISGIDNTLVDSYEYNTTQGREPHMIAVGPDIYAVAHTGGGGDGFIRTLTIDGAGDITPSILDTLEFDTSQARGSRLIHISGTTYAVVYSGPGSDGFIKTVDISTGGNIGTVIDTLEYDTSAGAWPDIIHVSGNVYAIAYQGPGADGFIKTVQIAGSGNIGSVLDSYEYDTTAGRIPSILHVDGTVYALAYSGTGNDGFISTISIAANGNIAGSLTDTLEFDTSDGREAHLIHVSGTIYAVAYRGPGTDGFLKTTTIAANGTIGTVIDTLEFNTTEGRYPSMEHVDGDTYAIAYQGPGSDGFVTLVTVQTNGQIDNSVIDTLEYDTSAGLTPDLLVLPSSTLAIASAGAGNDGFIDTIDLEYTSSGYSSNDPTIVPANTSYSVPNVSFWNSFAEVATKNGGEVYYQLSDDAGSTWQYWDGGSWSAAGAADYNTATVVNQQISSFATSTGGFLFQAFLSGDGTQLVILDDVQLGWSEITGSSGYVAGGFLVSSAFNTGAASKLQIVEWDESTTGCTATCTVRLQVRGASDAGGSPGTWSSWYGAAGPSTYFTNSDGTLIPTALNGNQWVQYRAELAGDTVGTPMLEEVRINYK